MSKGVAKGGRSKKDSRKKGRGKKARLSKPGFYFLGIRFKWEKW